MHRIDGPGATIDNLFTEGDPSIGMPATTVTGAWLNALQEEVANAIEGAGIVLDKPDNNQLLLAIQAIAAASIGWSTGDVKLTMKAAADSGWLLCNDGTIGNAVSGGTSRANADCEALFALLWNNVTNTYAAVSGGRGANAAADWAAGKTIALTKMLGRALGIAGTGASLSARAHGATTGTETHLLTTAEMPSHTHTINASINSNRATSSGGSEGIMSQLSTSNTQSQGGGGAHNNMQPTTFLNAMIKL